MLTAESKFRSAFTIEKDATKVVPLQVGDYLTHLEPFKVTISESYSDDEGHRYIAFRGIGRRAHALFQGARVTIFWTVAGNGSCIHIIDTEGHTASFMHLTLIKSIVRSLGRELNEQDIAPLRPVS